MATQNIEQQQRKLNAETLQNKLDMEEDQRKRRSSDMELTVDDSLLVEKNNGEDNSVKRLNVESLKPWLGSKIITWGPPVIEILEIGNLYAKVARKTGLFTVLLEGPPHSGKTTLAAHIAKNSNFEFFKVITPEDILNLDEFDNETAKCRYIREMFNEAYRASCSCILIDNIERLLNYCPIKQKYSTMMLQTLLVLLEKSPPPGHKLLILCTTNWTKCVDDLKLIPTFNAILEVPFLSTIEHVLNILTEVNLFSKHQMASFKAKLQEKQKVLIGIKNLLRLINIVREINSSDRVDDFLAKLEDEGELH
ncbi:PREDICTED: vesicle-fusing ATPase 2-like [Cyphomyrmex costatus]|uniref:Vesicle-fusing ATPase n=1 Tax=Cyphomyrmex costatus TaxID=456900 RepID=A0A151IKZ4_9HYME|nr:PREDICTED: vesicle-fusing ATPase 2-like [Cyphomyrmex costatus]KYN05274.1 Vesicle-fusing ATPase 1 [Cyphomyrmex costatus]